MPADITSVGDGLDELQAARLSRQNRRPPTPKRAQPQGETPAAVGEETPNDAPSAGKPPLSAPTPDATMRSGATSAPDRKTVAEPVQVDDGPLALVQVRVTESQLDYLDEIEAVAATRRLDITDAAVIRFALRQLMAAHSPEQIVERLGQPKVRGRRGRPRH